MENKLDILTKKLYNEGVEKARAEAGEIVNRAKEEAERIVREARAEAEELKAAAGAEAEALRGKAESEMTLAARQALAAARQSLVDLVTGEVAGEMARKGFEDKAFIQELLLTIVRKWDVAEGNLDLEVLLPEGEKESLEAFIAGKCKELLDKGLTLKVGGVEGEFVLQPRDGSYQLTFSEEVFEAFFARYTRGLTKELLFKK